MTPEQVAVELAEAALTLRRAKAAKIKLQATPDALAKDLREACADLRTAKGAFRSAVTAYAEARKEARHE